MNLCTKEEFVTKSGEKKTAWHPVGKMNIVEKEGGKKNMYIKLFIQPKETIYAFPPKDRNEAPPPQQATGGDEMDF